MEPKKKSELWHCRTFSGGPILSLEVIMMRCGLLKVQIIEMDIYISRLLVQSAAG